ncbi:hypothetical protein L211DRAFT_516252 [Terfezia boudieri ATCC MYA-4762]|uniref:Secreted protein n=1 Tax=Terfezia boudieri ATCC MYA-4762 TaxID=1051890 RepID=A0A3N4LCB8_9PEZI|nr:hypothetical protein L211DRAFT_516252 [Terfezia boudieri ATCC MYA-4762]
MRPVRCILIGLMDLPPLSTARQGTTTNQSPYMKPWSNYMDQAGILSFYSKPVRGFRCSSRLHHSSEGDDFIRNLIRSRSLLVDGVLAYT